MTVIGIDPSFRAFGISDGHYHWVIETQKGGAEVSQGADLYRRCRQIVGELMNWIGQQHDGEMIAFYVEAPAYGMASQGSHLVEVGWLSRELYGLVATFEPKMKIVEVSNSTVRKAVLGKGSISGALLPLAVYKKFGIEFDNDAKLDKLNAFLLYQYGTGVENGSIAFSQMAKRGDKRKKKAAA